MAQKFHSGDRVFAKIKGWPPWPARVVSRAEGKTEAYLIQFYGTYDSSTVKPDSMFLYGDDTKAKYGRPKGTSRWKEAMEEIENNIPIDDTGPLGEEEETGTKAEVDPDTDNDGELMIDEGPSQPPVLTKEVNAPLPANGRQTPAQPKGRRGSKASLSKRDSVSSTASNSAAEVTTPAVSAPAAGTELVSRSGRKIKPKRFADDEIPTTPVPTKTKASSTPGSQDEDGPPSSKRAKRGGAAAAGGKTPPSARATPTQPEPPPQQPTRPRMVIGKGRGAPGGKPAAGRISPDINSPVPRVPQLKPATTSVAAPPGQRRSEVASLPPGKKPLPALIPASAPVAVATAGPPVPRRAPALRHHRQVVMEEDLEESDAAMMAIANENDNDIDEAEAEVEADNKENLKESAPSSTNGSEMDDESEMEKGSEIDETSSRYSEAFDETLSKIPFTDKEGDQFEIRIETRQEFDTEDERAEYEAGVNTIVKLKEDLEQGDQETHETLQDLMEASKDGFETEESIQRERRAAQIRTLRVEGEVIEIIGEIVSCLGEKGAECFRALELLDRLGSHDLTALILKKHPEVVQTVGRLRNYIGNVEQWDMSEEQLEDFKDGSSQIRVKAQEIYSSFYSVFIPIEEQDNTVPFEEIFKEEMKVFREMTQDLTMDEILGLTAESEGGIYDSYENDLEGEEEYC